MADIADIRHGAHDCVFPDTAERNRLTFQLPHATVPDIMDIIGDNNIDSFDDKMIL